MSWLAKSFLEQLGQFPWEIRPLYRDNKITLHWLRTFLRPFGCFYAPVIWTPAPSYGKEKVGTITSYSPTCVPLPLICSQKIPQEKLPESIDFGFRQKTDSWSTDPPCQMLTLFKKTSNLSMKLRNVFFRPAEQSGKVQI